VRLAQGRHAWVRPRAARSPSTDAISKRSDGAGLTEEAAAELTARGAAEALVFDLA
jgi:hypothetical protein